MRPPTIPGVRVERVRDDAVVAHAMIDGFPHEVLLYRSLEGVWWAPHYVLADADDLAKRLADELNQQERNR